MSRFTANISSSRQLQLFNDKDSIPVDFDVLRSTAPDIFLMATEGPALSFWETRSASGFVTHPKRTLDKVTIRFITAGHIVYRSRTGDTYGTPSHATLVGFPHVREVQASSGFRATSASIAIDTLLAAQKALTGDASGGLPALAPLAAVDTPAMRALLCTVRQIQRRSLEEDRPEDLFVPLIQEIMGYQVLSAWPTLTDAVKSGTWDVSSRSLRDALDYIEANLTRPLRLADIAVAAGISVRALQNKFQKEVGRTPVQFILDQRLLRAHQDLVSDRHAAETVAEIATRWGFGHMSDFSQRYRKAYGRSPSEARPGSQRRR